MYNSIPKLDLPANEPVRPYLPGTPQTNALKARVKAMSQETIEVPLIIAGKDVTTGNFAICSMTSRSES